MDIELLTIQVRLVVASVEKAREMGMDWWTTNSDFRSNNLASPNAQSEIAELKQRLARLEAQSAGVLNVAAAASIPHIGSQPA